MCWSFLTFNQQTCKLSDILVAGRRDRDAQGYNRFRAVLSDNVTDARIEASLQAEWQQFAAGDERVHLHLVHRTSLARIVTDAHIFLRVVGLNFLRKTALAVFLVMLCKTLCSVKDRFGNISSKSRYENRLLWVRGQLASNRIALCFIAPSFDGLSYIQHPAVQYHTALPLPECITRRKQLKTHCRGPGPRIAITLKLLFMIFQEGSPHVPARCCPRFVQSVCRY